MTKPEWENICQRCGECCFEKIIDVDGTIYHTRIACRYLDIVTRECKVYHKRFETGEECIKLTPSVVRDAEWLTTDCAYVKWLETTKPVSHKDIRTGKKKTLPKRRQDTETTKG